MERWEMRMHEKVAVKCNIFGISKFNVFGIIAELLRSTAPCYTFCRKSLFTSNICFVDGMPLS